MPCTNVRILIGVTVDPRLYDLAKALAAENGVHLSAWVRDGSLEAYTDQALQQAQDWILVATAVASARNQGYRVEVVYNAQERIVTVAGVSA